MIGAQTQPIPVNTFNQNHSQNRTIIPALNFPANVTNQILMNQSAFHQIMYSGSHFFPTKTESPSHNSMTCIPNVANPVNNYNQTFMPDTQIFLDHDNATGLRLHANQVPETFQNNNQIVNQTNATAKQVSLDTQGLLTPVTEGATQTLTQNASSMAPNTYIQSGLNNTTAPSNLTIKSSPSTEYQPQNVHRHFDFFNWHQANPHGYTYIQTPATIKKEINPVSNQGASTTGSGFPWMPGYSMFPHHAQNVHLKTMMASNCKYQN